MAIVYLNGDFVPRDKARVSADDRGFTFGDGVYEGVRAIAGRRFAMAWASRNVAQRPTIVETVLRERDFGADDAKLFVLSSVEDGDLPHGGSTQGRALAGGRRSAQE